MSTLTSSAPLLLCSGSPRRREILEALRIPFVVAPVNVDEAQRPREASLPYLERVAGAKLAAARDTLRASPYPATLVADTIVVVDDRTLGKPVDDGDALAMLRVLAGRTHIVYTRYAVSLRDDTTRARTCETRVTFRSAPDALLERYVASGEGADKAGAYALQGLGAFLVTRLDGSSSNVIGLPACEVVETLLELRLLAEYP